MGDVMAGDMGGAVTRAVMGDVTAGTVAGVTGAVMGDVMARAAVGVTGAAIGAAMEVRAA